MSPAPNHSLLHQLLARPRRSKLHNKLIGHFSKGQINQFRSPHCKTLQCEKKGKTANHCNKRKGRAPESEPWRNPQGLSAHRVERVLVVLRHHQLELVSHRLQETRDILRLRVDLTGTEIVRVLHLPHELPLAEVVPLVPDFAEGLVFPDLEVTGGFGARDALSEPGFELHHIRPHYLTHS